MGAGVAPGNISAKAASVFLGAKMLAGWRIVCPPASQIEE